MAINPELITTIRVDQLPDETLSLTNLFPHTVGTELKSATIQELVDLVATSIGVSGGVGYLPISVTDGQQLPDVPESPGFFLCGAGTFLNINGYPNVICTENLNAIMSLSDHWQLAVEIPINPLSGTVQSVTGSAVDNTDPLNPVINEIIYGVQNIIAGTNITVDDTDPANPIISATGGGTTPTLQEVTEAGNETTNNIKVKDSEKSFTLQTNGISFEDINNEGNTLLKFENTSLTDQEVLVRGLGGTVALLSDIPTNTSDLTNDGEDGVNPFITALDIPTYTTPSIQEVLTDGGDEAVDSAIYFSNTANDLETSINKYGDGQIILRSVINDVEANIGAGIVYLGSISGGGVILNREKIYNTSSLNEYAYPTGVSSPLATLADITGGGGVPYTGATQDLDLGEFGLRAGQVTLDTTPTGTANVGTTRWNDALGSSETTLKGGNVILKNGVDLVARIVNKVNPNTTLTKAAYQVVKVAGAQGQRLAVDLARANSDLNSADTLGVVTETITTNQEGFILTVGQLEGVNTTGSLQGETWADGDVLYLSPTTAGRMTNIKPNGSNGHIVIIGYVEHAHNTQGKIYVKIMNGWELDELHNVFIDTPLNNQGLIYETSTDLWKNKTIIEDAIVNGVTAIAPSQNAVFDALALKQAVLSYTPYKNIQTSQTAHTGTTAETQIFKATIPAGSFNSTDVIKVLFGANKTTALGTYTLRLRVNSTDNFGTATLIGSYGGSASAQANVMMRNFNLNGGNLYGVQFATTAITDVFAGTALSSTTLNPANQFFIYASIVLSNASDNIIGNMLSIHN
jgi:nitrogen fixation protein